MNQATKPQKIPKLENEQLNEKFGFYLAILPKESIVPYSQNPVDHPAKQIRRLESYIETFGFKQPIVMLEENNELLCGHGRIEAVAGNPKIHELPVIVITDLNLFQARAFRIADNRAHDGSLWNDNLTLELAGIGEHLDDASALLDIDALLPPEALASGEDPDPQFARGKALQKKWGCEKGQLWEIPSESLQGKAHRLLCGDSTKSKDVQRVMDGEKAILFATDPPYLVDYDGKNHPHKWGAKGKSSKNKDWSDTYGITWDDSDQGSELYEAFYSKAVEHAIEENAAWYCWHASRRQAMLEGVWNKFGAFVHQQIIWAKDRPVMTHSWYLWQHEPCFFGWVKGKKPLKQSTEYQRTVWSVPGVNPPGKPTDHPTSKPSELFQIPMLQHTRKGDICYEPFAGSGSQLVAAELLGRQCRAIEIEPVYIGVILERMSEMGLEPKLSEG